MTTPQAAAAYEAAHVATYNGRPLAVHNPGNLPVDELPTIYGFNNGGSAGWMSAVLIAEDGTQLGGHCCSSEAYMPADLGCLEGTREDRHETFRQHYPNGYKMKFVGYDAYKSDTGIQAAVALAEKRAAEAQEQS